MKTLVRNYSGLLVFLFVFIIGAIISPVFIKIDNVMDIIQTIAENGLVAAGMTLVIISGGSGVDLSVGSNIALGGMIAALSQVFWGFSPIMSVAAAIIVSGLIGALNGLLITKGRLQPFVATLVTMIAARALALISNGGMPVSWGMPEAYRAIAGLKLGPVFLPAVIWIVVILGVEFVLRKTKFGRDLIASGGNEEAARYSGIKVNKVRFFAYFICGLFAGLAGAIMTSRLMIGEPRAGTGYELLAIAAVVMGGTSMEGGKGSALGTMFGVMTLGAISNLLNIINVNMYLQEVVRGFIVLIAILIPTFTQFLSDRVIKRKKEKAIQET